jgi:hypothetical protein
MSMSKQCIEHLVNMLMTVASSVLGGTAGARATADAETEDDEDVADAVFFPAARAMEDGCHSCC